MIYENQDSVLLPIRQSPPKSERSWTCEFVIFGTPPLCKNSTKNQARL